MIGERGYINFWECPNCGAVFKPTPNSIRYHTHLCVRELEREVSGNGAGVL